MLTNVEANRRGNSPDARALSKLGDLWERQPGEKDAAWLAFVAFRDAGPNRSLRGASKLVGRAEKQMRRWSTMWSWERRSNAFDIHLRGASRATYFEAQLKMVDRHANTAGAALSVVARPIHELATRMAAGSFDLRAMTDADLLRLVRDMIPMMRDLVGIERVARGIPANVDVVAHIEAAKSRDEAKIVDSVTTVQRVIVHQLGPEEMVAE